MNENEENVGDTISSEEQATKKARLSTCSTCLGLFSEDFQRELLQGILASDFAKYDCQKIVLAISLPMVLQLRQLAMWYALQRQFGASVDGTNPPMCPLRRPSN